MSPFPKYFRPLRVHPALLHGLPKSRCLGLLTDSEAEATVHELHGLPSRKVLAEVGLGLPGGVAFFGNPRERWRMETGDQRERRHAAM